MKRVYMDVSDEAALALRKLSEREGKPMKKLLEEAIIKAASNVKGVTVPKK